MPLQPPSLYKREGDIRKDLRELIDEFLSLIDSSVIELVNRNHLKPSEVRLLRPCSLFVGVDKEFVVVVISNIYPGGIPKRNYINFGEQEEPLEMREAIILAENQLFFEKPFGFSFPKQILIESDAKKREKAIEIAEKYIDDEERLNRLVRINPLFQGRDFMRNDNLVFVLTPFKEPFNTIYTDHIKPIVEAIDGITCLRADNIYDNKPIIEDIWRSINEAHIVISELTERNPNVFYETGIAHTVGKEVILITQNMDDVPFDLRHLRCIEYEYTPRGVEVLSTKLSATINNVRNRLTR